MHRTVLLAMGSSIEADAIMLTGGAPTPTPTTPPQVVAPTTSAPIETSEQNAPASAMPSAAEENKTADEGPFVARTVADVERQLIIETLDHYLGNRTHAANVLGISIRTLRNKLKIYSEEGFEVPDANASS